MIILNPLGIPVRLNDADVIINQSLLKQLGCKIWLDDFKYNRYATSKNLPPFSIKSDFLFIGMNDDGHYTLGSYCLLKRLVINTYSIEVFIKNLNGDELIVKPCH